MSLITAIIASILYVFILFSTAFALAGFGMILDSNSLGPEPNQKLWLRGIIFIAVAGITMFSLAFVLGKTGFSQANDGSLAITAIGYAVSTLMLMLISKPLKNSHVKPRRK